MRRITAWVALVVAGLVGLACDGGAITERRVERTLRVEGCTTVSPCSFFNGDDQFSLDGGFITLQHDGTLKWHLAGRRYHRSTNMGSFGLVPWTGVTTDGTYVIRGDSVLVHLAEPVSGRPADIALISPTTLRDPMPENWEGLDVLKWEIYPGTRQYLTYRVSTT